VQDDQRAPRDADGREFSHDAWVCPAASSRKPPRLAARPSGLTPKGHYPSGPLEITHGHKLHGAKVMPRADPRRP
jgi:hypothetical protein